MKLFRVTVESDGITTIDDGGKSTEITKSQFYFAAISMADLWERGIWFLRQDEERTIVEVSEILPAVTVVPDKAPD